MDQWVAAVVPKTLGFRHRWVQLGAVCVFGLQMSCQGEESYLLVEFCAVVVALLASPGNRVAHPGRVPGSDAGDLPQAFVSLPWEFLGMPPTRHPCRKAALRLQAGRWTSKCLRQGCITALLQMELNCPPSPLTTQLGLPEFNYSYHTGGP